MEKSDEAIPIPVTKDSASTIFSSAIRLTTYPLEACAVLAELEALGDGGDDLLVDGAVGVERNGQGQVVAVAVAAVDQLLVVAVAADDAGVGQTCGQQTLRQNGGESAEQVACTEMQPGRSLVRSLAHGVDVVLWQTVTLPGRVMFDTLFCQFHKSGHILSVNGAERALTEKTVLFRKNGRQSRRSSPIIYSIPKKLTLA